MKLAALILGVAVGVGLAIAYVFVRALSTEERLDEL